MYNTPYSYNSQMNIDRINNQIAELEKMKAQIPQQSLTPPTNLTQNFQLAPSNYSTLKYANSMDEVKREYVVYDTPFFSKDMSILWLKNNKNEIKTYELREIVPKDEKDLKIEYLQAQIEELKKGMMYSEQSNSNVDKSTSNATSSEKSAYVSTVPKTKRKSK